MSQNQHPTSPNGVLSQTPSTGDTAVNASHNEERLGSGIQLLWAKQQLTLESLQGAHSELDLQGIGSQFEDHPNIPSDLPSDLHQASLNDHVNETPLSWNHICTGDSLSVAISPSHRRTDSMEPMRSGSPEKWLSQLIQSTLFSSGVFIFLLILAYYCLIFPLFSLLILA